MWAACKDLGVEKKYDWKSSGGRGRGSSNIRSRQQTPPPNTPHAWSSHRRNVSLLVRAIDVSPLVRAIDDQSFIALRAKLRDFRRV